MEFKITPGTIAIGILTLLAVAAAIGWRYAVIAYAIQIASALIRGFVCALRD